MTEVPQFYNAANLRDSYASTWKQTMKTSQNWLSFILFHRIANSTKAQIINVGLQQLYAVDVEKGLAVITRVEISF